VCCCLQPLAVDWREKIKVSKGPAPKSAAAAPAPAPVKYSEQPDLEALSKGLPKGWKAMWDRSSGEVYYGNPSTKVRMHIRTHIHRRGRQLADTLTVSWHRLGLHAVCAGAIGCLLRAAHRGPRQEVQRASVALLSEVGMDLERSPHGAHPV
jgi:hypothetical protein